MPLRLVGTASGVCNMGPLLGGMLLQPAVGWILDQRWNGVLAAAPPQSRMPGLLLSTLTVVSTKPEPEVALGTPLELIERLAARIPPPPGQCRRWRPVTCCW